jgi:AraC-like DNA-binding protein
VLSKIEDSERHPCRNRRLQVVDDRNRQILGATKERDLHNIRDRKSPDRHDETPRTVNLTILNRPQTREFIEDPERDRQPIDIYYSQLGNFQIADLEWRSIFTIEQSPIVADYLICVPIVNRMENRQLDGQAICFNPDRAFTGITSRSGRVLFIGIDWRSIESVLTKLLNRALKQPIRFDSTIDLTTEFGTSLRGFVEFLGRSRDPDLTISSPLMQEELENALLACLIKGVKNNYSEEIVYHSQGAFACYVQKARAFIESHLDREIDLAGIAAAVNISPRLLQKAFAQEYDCSPMRFVMRSRLERIRQELERSNGNLRIIDVMMNYGISQGGKFAKDYQQLFGEKPSDTLKRAACQLDRSDYPLWQEIDDFRSEGIIGGLALDDFGKIDFSTWDILPAYSGDPIGWGGYLRSIGISLTQQRSLPAHSVDRQKTD